MSFLKSLQSSPSTITVFSSGKGLNILKHLIKYQNCRKENDSTSWLSSLVRPTIDKTLEEKTANINKILNDKIGMQINNDKGSSYYIDLQKTYPTTDQFSSLVKYSALNSHNKQCFDNLFGSVLDIAPLSMKPLNPEFLPLVVDWLKGILRNDAEEVEKDIIDPYLKL